MNKTKINWPYFAIVATICPPAAVPTAIVTTRIFAPNEDLLGYGAIGIAILSIVIVLVSGFICSIAALVRREKPRFLAIMAFLINVVALIWVLIKSPG